MAVDADGNLLIADTDNSRVRVVAASTGTFYGQADDRRGHLHHRPATAPGGSPATAARPPGPSSTAPDGVAVDAAGNLLIADLSNGRIRMVTG